jgi:hypothetical protein
LLHSGAQFSLYSDAVRNSSEALGENFGLALQETERLRLAFEGADDARMAHWTEDHTDFA